MRRIGFVSEKGGVAKTTTAINVAVGLARGAGTGRSWWTSTPRATPRSC
jgi:Mrp family chromosome partitioning ATPase